MTLLSHPQVREAMDACEGAAYTFFLADDEPKETRSPKKIDAKLAKLQQAEDALLTAILTALQAGEGLDFEAATHGPDIDRWLDRDELNAQHRARVGALRTEIATLREKLECSACHYAPALLCKECAS